MAWYVNFSREAPTSRRCPSKKFPRSWICSITDPESASDLPPLLKCCTSLDNSPPRNGEKEGRGCAPGPRGSWPALSRSLVLGIVVFGTIVGLFRPVCQDRFGTHFREKYAGTHFCERKFPNQGTQMGAEIAQRPEQCATTAKTSERKRAGHKTGGPGGTAPGALSSGFLRRKPGSRPEAGGNPRGRSGPASVLTGPPCQLRQGDSHSPAGPNSRGCICSPRRAAATVAVTSPISATREVGLPTGSSWRKGTK